VEQAAKEERGQWKRQPLRVGLNVKAHLKKSRRVTHILVLLIAFGLHGKAGVLVLRRAESLCAAESELCKYSRTTVDRTVLEALLRKTIAQQWLLVASTAFGQLGSHGIRALKRAPQAIQAELAPLLLLLLAVAQIAKDHLKKQRSATQKHVQWIVYGLHGKLGAIVLCPVAQAI
jgi:hypothetical protein